MQQNLFGEAKMEPAPSLLEEETVPKKLIRKRGAVNEILSCEAYVYCESILRFHSHLIRRRDSELRTAIQNLFSIYVPSVKLQSASRQEYHPLTSAELA